MKEHALSMAAAGIPIFPCQPGTKRPLVAHGFHAATTDQTAIAAWWSQWPDALIARPTGSGVVVIDTDLDAAKSPPKDGERALAELEAKHGPLHETYTVKTPRGGRHRYYRVPEGIKVPSRTDKPAYGMDVRGDGGYVIVPPSPGYEVLNDGGEADLPASWLEMLREQEKPPRANVFESSDWEQSRAREALRHIPADCDRDTWLFVGMALHDGGLAYEDFDRWSAMGGAKYQGPQDTRKVWDSFKPGGGRTLGTLFALAQEHGYLPWGSTGPRDSTSAPEAAPESAPVIVPYSTRGWAELSRLMLPPQVCFWGDGFAMGQVSTIFGQGGLGKSRLSLNLARNQVLGLPFADIPTSGQPLRHLLMGSENSIHRLQNDVRRMSGGLSPEQLERLDAHIRMATLEHPEDPFITVASPMNLVRWKTTLESFRPQVLWVDPWGDVLDGEANNDEDTRGTLQVLRRLLRQVDPDAALVILAHSRTGAKNIAQAVGFDAPNFGKGSKALYTASRCVLNLAPGDESEAPPIVCCFAKHNDGRRQPPFAIILDPSTMLYERDPDFDFEAWQELVNTRASGKSRSGRPATSQPLDSFRPLIPQAFAEGPIPKGILSAKVQSLAKVGDKRARAIIDDWIHSDLVKKTPRMKEKDGRVFYGTPDQIEAMLRLTLPGIPV